MSPKLEGRSECYLRTPPPGIRRRSRLTKHEGEDEEEDEDALTRVHDNPHPHALPPPRGKANKEDVRHQGGGDRPRLVQMVEGEKTPLATKSPLPKTPRIRGSRSPVKSRSSPSTLLKMSCATTTAYQLQAPLKNSSPRVSRNKTRSLLAGPVMSKPKNSQIAKRRTKGITHSHTLPPTHPLLGSRGESSQRASRTRDQRSVPCSRLVRIRVRTNCQMSPAVMHSSRALMNATSPPPSRDPSKGATTHPRTAIGMAAADHTARI